MMALAVEFSQEIFNQKNTITIIGHSAGGGAIKQAAIQGAFEYIKPNRIVFSDADYADYTKTTWDTYIKQNRSSHRLQTPSNP